MTYIAQWPGGMTEHDTEAEAEADLHAAVKGGASHGVVFELHGTPHDAHAARHQPTRPTVAPGATATTQGPQIDAQRSEEAR